MSRAIRHPLVAALIAGVIPLAASAAATEPARSSLRVAVFPERARPEFFAVDGEELPGFEREILEGFARAQKLTLSVVPVSQWEGLVPALIEKKADVIAGHFTITEDRRSEVDFTVGILPIRSVVLTHKPHPPVTSLTQLQKEKIGAIKATAVLEELIAAGIPKSSIDDSLTPNNILDSLRTGKVTAVVRSIPLAVLSQRDDPDIELGMFFGSASSFAFGVRKGDAALRRALDAHIELLRESGQWNRLVVKYFGASALAILKKAQIE